MNEHLPLGFQLMGYGLVGVFSVLILLIGTIKVLTELLPDRKEKGEGSGD